MAFKLLNATELRVGSFAMIDGEAFQIKNMDISKTGKHGHAKCRFEAVSLTGGKKKVLVVPGHERFEIPMIGKNKAQILSLTPESANVMDLESYENLELNIPEDLKGTLKEEDNVEYWDIEGKKIIKRVL